MGPTRHITVERRYRRRPGGAYKEAAEGDIVIWGRFRPVTVRRFRDLTYRDNRPLSGPDTEWAVWRDLAVEASFVDLRRDRYGSLTPECVRALESCRPARFLDDLARDVLRQATLSSEEEFDIRYQIQCVLKAPKAILGHTHPYVSDYFALQNLHHHVGADPGWIDGLLYRRYQAYCIIGVMLGEAQSEENARQQREAEGGMSGPARRAREAAFGL